MAIRIQLRVGVDNLEGLRGHLMEMTVQPSGKLSKALSAAGVRYSGYIRRRFVEQSKGGGDWPDLAPSTQLARARKTKAGKARFKKRRAKLSDALPLVSSNELTLATLAGMHFDILRDTGALLNSLTPGGPLATEEPMLFGGIAVGTADRVARFHQFGGPRLPARPIIVPPDEQTRNAMGMIMAKALGSDLTDWSKTK
jgi:hypothetical protein